MCRDTEHETGSFWELKEMGRWKEVEGARRACLGMISRYIDRGWIRSALCTGPQGCGVYNSSCKGSLKYYKQARDMIRFIIQTDLGGCRLHRGKRGQEAKG